MPTITGKVTEIERLDSKAGAPYWKVHIKGKEYVTSREETIGDLHAGAMITAEVVEEKKGNYTNRYFNSWEYVTGLKQDASASQREVMPTATVIPETWEAKDRRIAMESAYSSAARFYRGLGAEPKALAALARAIYRDIQLAGKGVPFPPLKDERPQNDAIELPYTEAPPPEENL